MCWKECIRECFLLAFLLCVITQVYPYLKKLHWLQVLYRKRATSVVILYHIYLKILWTSRTSDLKKKGKGKESYINTTILYDNVLCSMLLNFIDCDSTTYVNFHSVLHLPLTLWLNCHLFHFPSYKITSCLLFTYKNLEI